MTDRAGQRWQAMAGLVLAAMLLSRSADTQAADPAATDAAAFLKLRGIDQAE